jgi:hypothetical protein
MWRSPVAYLYGVQGVAGSNPVIPTRQKKQDEIHLAFFINYSPIIRTGPNNPEGTSGESLSK